MTSRNQREGHYAGQILSFHMRTRLAGAVSASLAERALVRHSQGVADRMRRRRVQLRPVGVAMLPNDRSQG